MKPRQINQGSIEFCCKGMKEKHVVGGPKHHRHIRRRHQHVRRQGYLKLSKLGRLESLDRTIWRSPLKMAARVEGIHTFRRLCFLPVEAAGGSKLKLFHIHQRLHFLPTVAALIQHQRHSKFTKIRVKVKCHFHSCIYAG
ncbi:unnamed protein product [Cuscuta epithymum]|uniref:Uncharacterized protein n=1 Tax=Cuscuta epithymum TaxID=186058 RepID=A0AAV0CGK6_9ASTE|nr:unnamed protein product [Cuscuta epithymum]